MRIRDTASLTPHRDVNALLGELAERVHEALGPKLFGLYLTGSLAYGGFERGSSDVDFIAVLTHAMTAGEFASVKAAHARIAERHPSWARRIEGSYVTRDMLAHVAPPPTARPYINQGAFWDPDPRYGNEWLVNLHALRARGVALIGPVPEALIAAIDIAAVREASRRDLLDEWEPKLRDDAYLANSHHQAYAVLTLCRILHRAAHDGVPTKREAAAFVKQLYGQRWAALVQAAERWRHGDTLDAAAEIKAFIRFTLQLLRAD
jgi:Domain of unknown function (DUF4111)